MKIQEIRELIKLIDYSSIDEFTLEADGTKVKMKKYSGVTYEVQQPVAAAPAPQVVAPTPVVEVKHEVAPAVEAPKAAAVVEDASLHKITSPMVGTFYASPSPDAPAFVQVGDRVDATKVVCIVEAMKLFNEIEAEVTGEIVEVLVQNGQLVEYGQPLFLVKA